MASIGCSLNLKRAIKIPKAIAILLMSRNDTFATEKTDDPISTITAGLIPLKSDFKILLSLNLKKYLAAIADNITHTNITPMVPAREPQKPAIL